MLHIHLYDYFQRADSWMIAATGNFIAASRRPCVTARLPFSKNASLCLQAMIFASAAFYSSITSAPLARQLRIFAFADTFDYYAPRVYYIIILLRHAISRVT